MTNTQNDSLSVFVSKLIAACKKHSKPLLTFLIVLIVLVGGTALYCTRAERVRQESWAMFYQAQTVLLSQGEEAGFAAIDALDAAYPGTNAAQYGRLLQADAMFTQDNYAQALDIYQTLSTAKNKYVRQVALLSLATAQQAVGEYKTAAETAQSFIAKYPTSFALPQAYLTLGLSQELAGDKEAALATYKTILENYTTSYFGVFAKDKITALNK